MKPLTDFLPEVMPIVPGCPQPVVINAIRNSVIEFLERSGMLEQTISVSIDPSDAAHSIDCDEGAKPVAFVGGRLVSPVSSVRPVAPSALEAERPDWRAETGVPSEAFILGGLLVVVPRPTVACELEATFTVSLKRSATRVEDVIFEDWLEGVASGALERLLMMPGVPWANPELGVMHREQAALAASEATILKFKGSTGQSLRVIPRAFG